MTRRLLYVAARWPFPVASGRQRMIEQTLRLAIAAGYEVHVRVLARAPGPALPAGHGLASIEALPLPGMPEVAANLALRRCGTLQESLFRSGAAAVMLGRAATAIQPAIVIFDTIRAAQYGMDPAAWPQGIRRIADLDDLLSVRYRAMASGGSEGALLGYFSATAPWAVRVLASRLPAIPLRLEAFLAGRRERAMAASFDAIIMTAPLEAAALRAMVPAAKIVAVPPSVQPIAAPVATAARPRFVFLGPGSYGPNAASLDLISAAGAVLAQRGIAFQLDWAGLPGGYSAGPGINGVGFVDQLSDILTPDAVLVAPIGPGTGIVTKVLDAMARAVPVITTRHGLRGLDGGPTPLAIVADGATGFADAIAAVIADPAAARATGIEGWHYVRRHHDQAVVAGNLADALG